MKTAKTLLLATISALLMATAIGCGTTDHDRSMQLTDASSTGREAVTPKADSDVADRDRAAAERKTAEEDVRNYLTKLTGKDSAAPTWVGEVKGTSKEASVACAAEERWSNARNLYGLVAQYPGINAYVDQDKAHNLLVDAVSAYLSGLAVAVSKTAPCMSQGEGGADGGFSTANVEDVIDTMEKSAITPEEAGTTAAGLRALHLKYLKVELPDTLKGFRRGGSDAEGILWSYLHEWRYTPAELGLTKAEADKILKGVGGDEAGEK